MKTEDLIVELAGSAGAVRRLARPSIRLLRWASVSVVVAVMMVWLIGPRPDLGTALRNTSFATVALLTIVAAVAAAAAALVLSVPGAERTPAQRAVPLGLLGGWAVLLVIRVIQSGSPVARLLAFPVHVGCIAQIVVVALLPGWLLFSMIRKAAPLSPTWSSMLATLAAAALGAAATQLLCPIDDPAHHLAGHLVPVVLFTVIVGLVARSTIDWRVTPARRQNPPM